MIVGNKYTRKNVKNLKDLDVYTCIWVDGDFCWMKSSTMLTPITYHVNKFEDYIPKVELGKTYHRRLLAAIGGLVTPLYQHEDTVFFTYSHGPNSKYAFTKSEYFLTMYKLTEE